MIPPTKALSFLQGLTQAQAETAEGLKAKAELKKSLTTVKKIADQPGVKKSLREELNKLESNLLKVASMEKDLLSKEDMDTRDLKFQISDLKTKLALTGAQGLKPSLDKISYLLGELTARVETYTRIKTDREVRMEELEKKIKENMDKNFSELIKMEKTLADLEERYEDLKKTEKTSEETLQRIEDKMAELRGKLIEKREEIVENKKQEIVLRQTQLPGKPIPPPKLFYPEEEKIRHEMFFPKEMPEAPKFTPEEFTLPPEFTPERKGFVGWLKGLFGR